MRKRSVTASICCNAGSRFTIPMRGNEQRMSPSELRSALRAERRDRVYDPHEG